MFVDLLISENIDRCVKMCIIERKSMIPFNALMCCCLKALPFFSGITGLKPTEEPLMILGLGAENKSTVVVFQSLNRGAMRGETLFKDDRLQRGMLTGGGR